MTSKRIAMESVPTRKRSREVDSLRAVIMKEVFMGMSRPDQTKLILDFMKSSRIDTCARVKYAFLRDRADGETLEQYSAYKRRHRFEDWMYNDWNYVICDLVVTVNYLDICFSVLQIVMRRSTGFNSVRDLNDRYREGYVFAIFDGTSLFEPGLDYDSKYYQVIGNNDQFRFRYNTANTHIVCYDPTGVRGITKIRFYNLFRFIYEGLDTERLMVLLYFLGYFDISEIDPDSLGSFQQQINYSLYRSDTAPVNEKEGDLFEYYNTSGNPAKGTKWELLEARFWGLRAANISSFREFFFKDPGVPP